MGRPFRATRHTVRECAKDRQRTGYITVRRDVASKQESERVVKLESKKERRKTNEVSGKSLPHQTGTDIFTLNNYLGTDSHLKMFPISQSIECKITDHRTGWSLNCGPCELTQREPLLRNGGADTGPEYATLPTKRALNDICDHSEVPAICLGGYHTYTFGPALWLSIMRSDSGVVLRDTGDAWRAVLPRADGPQSQSSRGTDAHHA
ncbi:hypothetical protein CBL_09418 [Carabus blaptoides fortunei]